MAKPKIIETAPAPQQAPETSTGSIKGEKQKRAEHELLAADGAVVEDEENANGVRYTLLALPESPFTYQYGENATVDKFLAILGAKTLATNESSAVRNNPKGAGTAEEQLDAVKERFALLATGTWVDRAREGVGAKVDKDKLAEAICLVMIGEGKATEEQINAGIKAARRQRLDDDKEYFRKVRQFPAVANKYAELMGRTTMSASDL